MADSGWQKADSGSTLPYLCPRQTRKANTPLGTPGTGKSLHALLLSQALRDSSTPLTHLNIGDIVKEKGFHEGYDDEWQSYTVDEDRLLDHLEEVVNPEEAPAETGTLRFPCLTYLRFASPHRDPFLHWPNG